MLICLSGFHTSHKRTWLSHAFPTCMHVRKDLLHGDTVHREKFMTKVQMLRYRREGLLNIDQQLNGTQQHYTHEYFTGTARSVKLLW